MIKKVEDQTKMEHSSFAHSSKVYVNGNHPGVHVPMREISLSPSQLPDGETAENEAVRQLLFFQKRSSFDACNEC